MFEAFVRTMGYVYNVITEIPLSPYLTPKFLLTISIAKKRLARHDFSVLNCNISGFRLLFVFVQFTEIFPILSVSPNNNRALCCSKVFTRVKVKYF